VNALSIVMLCISLAVLVFTLGLLASDDDR
jgi:hypothetical protein